MEQKIMLNVHFLDFKHFSKASSQNFKLRFSILREPIPEQKMIKGTQPLAGYNPKEFLFSKIINSNEKIIDNQMFNFNLTREFDPMLPDDHLNEQRKQKFADLVVELFVETAPDSKLAKVFSIGPDGFVNIGHNMLRIHFLGRNLHEPVQVVFDEVLFCSAGLALHVCTRDFSLKSKTQKEPSKFLCPYLEWLNFLGSVKCLFLNLEKIRFNMKKSKNRKLGS